MKRPTKTPAPSTTNQPRELDANDLGRVSGGGAQDKPQIGRNLA